MSVFSDVGVAVQTEVLRALSSECRAVLAEADDSHEIPEGTIFLFREVKWYRETNENIRRLYAELEQHDKTVSATGYRIVVVAQDYPTDDSDDAGGWFDNPWNLHRQITVDLHLERPRHNG